MVCAAALLHARRISEIKRNVSEVEGTLAKVDDEHLRTAITFSTWRPPELFWADRRATWSATGLMTEDSQHWRRVIIEKPFGHDLESAKALNKQLVEGRQKKSRFTASTTTWEKRPFRIFWRSDFANGIFEPIWNRRYIDHVQISVAETVGVEQRGGYYDQAGALRDMVPNHIMQLISLDCDGTARFLSMRTRCGTSKQKFCTRSSH